MHSSSFSLDVKRDDLKPEGGVIFGVKKSEMAFIRNLSNRGYRITVWYRKVEISPYLSQQYTTQKFSYFFFHWKYWSHDSELWFKIIRLIFQPLLVCMSLPLPAIVQNFHQVFSQDAKKSQQQRVLRQLRINRLVKRQLQQKLSLRPTEDCL